MSDQPTALIVADTHYRSTAPVNRKKGYITSMLRKARFIAKLQAEYDVPLLHGGDVFHKWKDEPWLLSRLIRTMQGTIVCVPGQHDLPYHNIDLLKKSNLGVMAAAGNVTILGGMDDDDYPWVNGCAVRGFPWGAELEPYAGSKTKQKKIAIVHKLTYHGKKDWPDMVAPSAKKVMQQLKGYDLIITGDNHRPFVVEGNGQLLVNPGSMMRNGIDQVDHKPRVYLWYAATNTVKPIYLPLQEDAFDLTTHTKVKDHNQRIEHFVNNLETEFEIDLDFAKNIESFVDENKIHHRIKKIIWEAIENE